MVGRFGGVAGFHGCYTCSSESAACSSWTTKASANPPTRADPFLLISNKWTDSQFRRICWIIVTCACNCSPLHIMITSRFRIPFFLGSRRLAFFQYMVIRVDSQVSVYVCSIIKRLATSSQHWRPAVGVARKQLASSFQSCALHQQPWQTSASTSSLLNH